MPDKVKSNFDVVVIGAGPAGLCATLRLLDLGYSVAIIERSEFPRGQIGESLSPGIRNIFEYLRVTQLLDRPEYLQQLPANVIWSQPEPVYQPGHEKNGLIVDRSTLDSDLLAVTAARGAFLLQPATVQSKNRIGETWELEVDYNGTMICLTTRILLDARGRKSVLKRERLETAAPMVAIWTHVPASFMPQETRVEAIAEGWFWGSPLPNCTYRILLFATPEAVKQHNTARFFADALKVSALFRQLALDCFPAEIQTCSVLSYVHYKPWDENYIRIGEAAFALDPLSSTGVEKAMRFSLQTAIAVNTLLKTGNVDIAIAFYEEKLAEAVITHKRWTEDFYLQSWANTGNPFWKNTRHEIVPARETGSAFTEKFMQQFRLPVKETAAKNTSNIPVNTVLSYLANFKVSLCSKTAFRSSFSITTEIVEIKEAVHHPNLKQDIVFLDGIELKPLLAGIIKGMTFEGLLLDWATNLSLNKAKKLMVFLWSHEILKAG